MEPDFLGRGRGPQCLHGPGVQGTPPEGDQCRRVSVTAQPRALHHLPRRPQAPARPRRTRERGRACRAGPGEQPAASWAEGLPRRCSWQAQEGSQLASAATLKCAACGRHRGGVHTAGGGTNRGVTSDGCPGAARTNAHTGRQQEQGSAPHSLERGAAGPPSLWGSGRPSCSGLCCPWLEAALPPLPPSPSVSLRRLPRAPGVCV